MQNRGKSNEQNPHPELQMLRSPLFLIPILLFGLLLALLTPPFQSPDEPNHFLRAWQISEGQFVPEQLQNRIGGTLPLSLSTLCDSFSFLKNDQEARLSLQGLKNGFSIPLDKEHRQFTDFANTAVYAPTAYIPQAAAIALLRPFGLPPLALFYAARLANLLAWALLVFAALRLMPFMRGSLAAIALLPASICIAASCNADVITNGLCWYLVATFLAENGRGFWKKLLAIVVVAMNKLIALPLVLLAGFSKMKRRQVAILFAASTVAALVWGYLAQGWFIPYDAYDPAFRDTQTLNSGVDPGRQLAFIFQHPWTFLKVFSSSLFHALPSMAAHFVGKFGWEKNYLPAGWMALFWIALLALFFSDKNPLSNRQRWGIGGIAGLYILAFAVTMYALWTAVGATHLENWQGRYFIPIAPLLMLAVGRDVLGKWRPWIEKIAFGILMTGNFAMVYCLWLRYWV